MSSVMRFWGGPLDGKEIPPQEGWRAPGKYLVPSHCGRFHFYQRYEVTENGEHLYSYKGLKAREWEGEGNG